MRTPDEIKNVLELYRKSVDEVPDTELPVIPIFDVLSWVYDEHMPDHLATVHLPDSIYHSDPLTQPTLTETSPTAETITVEGQKQDN